MNFEQITEKRRAINFFDSKQDVSEEQLKKIVELAARTPSSFNLQPWNIMVLREVEEKEKLKAIAWDQPKIVEAPVVLIILADTLGWRESHPIFEKNWKKLVESGFMQKEKREWFLNATNSLYNWNPKANLAFGVKNASFFAMSLMYAATSLGLHTHPMDGFDYESVKKQFKIPENYWIPLLLAVGYKKTDIELSTPKWRKTYNEIVISF